jgi:hypothetical protein
MRLRMTKVDEFQFLTCLQHEVWGSNSDRFKDWKVGDYLLILVNKALAGLAEVSGKPFVSKHRVWDNGLFPHRIPLKFLHVLVPENRPPVLGEIRDCLTSVWGPSYGWGILNQQLLSDHRAETIITTFRSHRNDLAEVKANLDRQLRDAKLQREAVVSQKRKPARPSGSGVELPFDKKLFPSKEEESAHSRSQSALIRLGKTTGCSVWVGSNDRTRLFKGKSLGEGCLKSLPRLGLSEEATKRISLIDVIWIRQNARVCAFEVEATTSIYSGLLRMSDLLSVVPALNMKLFIVASRERQDKVMAELARPTFQRIGLSEFCRFIASEDLEALCSKLADLEGHVQPTIADTVSIELEDELEII